MSSSSHSPPQCQLQKRVSELDPIPRIRDKDNRLHVQDREFPSQGVEGTSWLDDFLVNSKTRSVAISIQRSESDPVALQEASSVFHSPGYFGSSSNAISTTDGSETDFDLDTASLYGPNSPRQKNQLTDSESRIVSALLENASQNHCQDLSENCSSGLGYPYSDDIHSVSCHQIPQNAWRRRSRQRSRTLKLQYIAELERAVDSYKMVGAELAGNLASVFQQYVIMSMENKRLKQQILILQQHKLIKDGQYLYLKNEVERLRTLYAQLHQTRTASKLPDGALAGIQHRNQLADVGSGKTQPWLNPVR